MNALPGSRTPLMAALAALSVFIGFFYGIGSVPLFDLDEGAFSEATREMLVNGDFISTYLNGAPRYDKPILIYWLQAASVSLLGGNEFAYRLPSAVAGTLWVALVYLFVRRVRDTRHALMAAIMVASTLSVNIIGKAATADALLNLFLAAAMFASFLYLQTRERRYLYGVFAAAGLGFLTKGPVAALIPLAVTFLYCAVRRDLEAWLRAVIDPRGLVLFLLIAAPWYVVQYLKEGDAFVQGFFYKHNLNRFHSPMEGHGGSLLYYVPVLLIGVLPYTTPVLRTLARFRPMARDDLGLFMLLWFGFVFVFFSLSGTKLPHYLIYGYTGLIILAAVHLGELRSRAWAMLPPLLFAGVLVALPWLIGVTLPLVRDPYYQEALRRSAALFPAGYYAYFIVLIVVMFFFMVEKRLAIAHKLLLCGLLLSFGVAALLLPTAGRILQEPVKEAALIAREHDYPVVMWGLNTPSFNVYSHRLVEKRNPRPGDVVLTKAPRLSRLKNYEILYRKNGVALIRMNP